MRRLKLFQRRRIAVMALSTVAIRKFRVAIILLCLIAVIFSVRAEAAWFNSPEHSAHVSSGYSMEADDLSFEEQQQVMDVSEKLDGVTRKLLTSDPYYPNY